MRAPALRCPGRRHTRSPPIAHRDLKSPNLLVSRNWDCKVGIGTGLVGRWAHAHALAARPNRLALPCLACCPNDNNKQVVDFGLSMWIGPTPSEKSTAEEVRPPARPHQLPAAACRWLFAG